MQFNTSVFKRRFAVNLSGPGGDPSPSHDPPIIDVTTILSIASDEDFIREAYRQILGRECDYSGFANYRKLLAAGLPRKEFLTQIAQSSEGKASRRQLVGLVDWTRPSKFHGRSSLYSRLCAFSFNKLLVFRNFVLRSLGIQTLDTKLDYLLTETIEVSHSQSAHLDSAFLHLSEKIDRQSESILHELQRRAAAPRLPAGLLLADLPPASPLTLPALRSLNGNGCSLAFALPYSAALLAASGQNPVQWVAELCAAGFAVHKVDPASGNLHPVGAAELVQSAQVQLVLLPSPPHRA